MLYPNHILLMLVLNHELPENAFGPIPGLLLLHHLLCDSALHSFSFNITFLSTQTPTIIFNFFL
jgi:hypothetical protein